MPSKLFHAKDPRYPSFILPDYKDHYESFYPFIRLKEPWGWIQKIKFLFLLITVFPLRFIGAVITFPIDIISAMIGVINYDATDLNCLSQPVPLWRYICHRICRWLSGSWGLFTFAFYKPNIIYYSYKDMQDKFNYKLPKNYTLKYDKNGNEIHEKCHIITSNHLGLFDILFFMNHFNGCFVSKAAIKDVFGFGAICTAMASLYLKKGCSFTETLMERVKFNRDYHIRNPSCKGCSLCLSNLVIFPEGTTTNGNNLLMFRTGIFNAGLPIRPIVIKCKWNNLNTTWESISFKTLIFWCANQFYNNMTVYVAPPYIPNDQEKIDSVKYAYNMNILMAQMYGLNNDHEKPKIYLSNRDIKVKCYHHHPTKGIDVVARWAKQYSDNDGLISKYLDCIKNDDRYVYDDGELNQQDET